MHAQAIKPVGDRSRMLIEDALPSLTPSPRVRGAYLHRHRRGARLAALISRCGGEWPAMFLCLGVALFVDGIDGTFARRLEVAELLPRWSGDVLDLVVDFVTYVFVPAYAIAASGLLPQPLAIPAGIVIVVTGALYFADRDMKTADNYFRGFPALWNAVAFYLFVLKPPPWLAAVVDRRSGGADLRAVQVPASVPGDAAAGDQYRGDRRCGACSP